MIDLVNTIAMVIGYLVVFALGLWYMVYELYWVMARILHWLKLDGDVALAVIDIRRARANMTIEPKKRDNGTDS